MGRCSVDGSHGSLPVWAGIVSPVRNFVVTEAPLSPPMPRYFCRTLTKLYHLRGSPKWRRNTVSRFARSAQTRDSRGGGRLWPFGRWDSIRVRRAVTYNPVKATRPRCGHRRDCRVHDRRSRPMRRVVRDGPDEVVPHASEARYATGFLDSGSISQTWSERSGRERKRPPSGSNG